MNSNFTNVGCHPITDILSRLSRVKKSGGSYTACCPGHHDRRPSLRITETDGGTVLLKCWIGCSALEIVNAVGLELRDLFADKSPRYTTHRPVIEPWLLERLQLVSQIGASWLSQGKSLNDIDLRAYRNAARITGVYGEGDPSWMVGPGPETASDSQPPIHMASDEVWGRIETQAAQRTSFILKDAVAAGNMAPNA